MRKGKRAVGLMVAAALLVAAVGVSMALGVARGAAEEEQMVGRYQAAAPDLVLDTATGKLTTSAGQMLEGPVDPSATEVGRYSVASYMTVVTRMVALSAINVPIVYNELVKGYAVVDTKTGRIIKQRIYYSAPLQPGEI